VILRTLAALLLTGCNAFGVPRCPEPAPQRELVAESLASRVALGPTLEELPMEPARQLAFARDGTRLLSAGEDVLAVSWDLAARRERAECAPPEGGLLRFFLAVQADHDLVALRDGSRAAVYRLGEGRLHRLDGHRASSEFGEPVDSASFSPNGRLLATGDDLGSLRLWDLSDGRLVYARSIGSGRLSALTFSPDGQTLAAATDNDDGVRLLRAADGMVIGWLPTRVDRLYHLDYSRDGARLMASDFSDGAVVWALDRCERIDLQNRPDDFASDVKISPDGTVVAAALAEGLALWSAESGALLSHVQSGRPGGAGDRAFRALAFSPDQTLLAVATHHGVELVSLERAARDAGPGAVAR
jgi:WD40 repeat protein